MWLMKTSFAVPRLVSCLVMCIDPAILCLRAVSQDGVLQIGSQAVNMIVTFSWRFIILSFILFKATFFTTPLWRPCRHLASKKHIALRLSPARPGPLAWLGLPITPLSFFKVQVCTSPALSQEPLQLQLVIHWPEAGT